MIGGLLFAALASLLLIFGSVMIKLGWYALSVPVRRLWRALRLRAPIKAAGRHLLLEHRAKGLLLEGVLAGERDGFQVKIEAASMGALKEVEDMIGRTRFSVDSGGLIPPSLTIAATRRRIVGHVDTRDPEFDGRLAAFGERDQVLSRLSSQVRIRLHALAPQIEVRMGRVTYETPIVLREVRLIEHVMGELIGLAGLLSFSQDEIPERLLFNALHDPVVMVRYTNMEVLLDRYPGSAQAEKVIEVYLGSRDPQMSLLAAMHAGEAGIERVKEIADSGHHVRIKALLHLACHLSKEESSPFLERALLRGTEPVRSAVATQINRLHWKDKAPLLERALKGAGSTSTSAIISCLFGLDLSRAEPIAIRLLSHENEGVVLTSARLLGSFGRSTAIAPLAAVVDTPSFSKRANVSRTLRGALEAIRRRCKDRGQGGLSLSAPTSEHEGALSTAKTEGALSASETEG